MTNAQARGAVGVLIYSDPFDDGGFGNRTVYPNGILIGSSWSRLLHWVSLANC